MRPSSPPSMQAMNDRPSGAATSSTIRPPSSMSATRRPPGSAAQIRPSASRPQPSGVKVRPWRTSGQRPERGRRAELGPRAPRAERAVRLHGERAVATAEALADDQRGTVLGQHHAVREEEVVGHLGDRAVGVDPVEVARHELGPVDVDVEAELADPGPPVVADHHVVEQPAGAAGHGREVGVDGQRPVRVAPRGCGCRAARRSGASRRRGTRGLTAASAPRGAA